MTPAAKLGAEAEIFWTVAETASFLRISKVSVWRLLATHKLKRFKIGSRTLVRRRDVEALVREA